MIFQILSILSLATATTSPTPTSTSSTTTRARGTIASTLVPCSRLVQSDGTISIEARKFEPGFNPVCGLSKVQYLGAHVERDGTFGGLGYVDEATGTLDVLAPDTTAPVKCVSFETECGKEVEICAEYNGLFSWAAWVLVCDKKTQECESVGVGPGTC